MHPNKLGLCAGHVPSHEDSLTAMQREIAEELGVNINKSFLKFLTTEKKEKSYPNGLANRIFNDVYYLTTDKKINEFLIQLEELSEIFWVDYQEFKNKCLNNDPEVVFRKTPTDIQTFKLLDQIYSKIIHKEL
jgi:8-oxo-dGTP pyrophosphatase MutT (NUDIX family)